MPLASDAAFTDALNNAPGQVPSGVAGVSGTSSDGKYVVSNRAAGADAPEAYGGLNAVYTTARVALTNRNSTAGNTVAGDPVTGYPYRATGKLWARWGSSWFVCTASLIKKGVLITAAHCIFNYGQGSSGWANEVRFYPANISNPSSATQPYGYYSHRQLRIPTPYFNGTDVCTQAGVVCNNDIATVVLNTASSQYAGNVVGWYGYGWNGYSYRSSPFLGNVTAVQITQLGYPVAFDSGYQMQRTDAVGWYFTSGNLKNTQIGSAQTGGSSGGPWLTNFGTRPSLSSAASLGLASSSNVVVGTTSYGQTTVGNNRQGASFFGQNTAYPLGAYGSYGAGNIGKIVQDTCTAQPAYC